MATDWKGAGSLKPCLWCSDTWSKGHRCIGNAVDITCKDPRLFSQMTEEILKGNIETLELAHENVVEGRMSQTAFDELEKALGFRFNPDGLLFDKALGAIICFSKFFRTDWVHNNLQSASLSVEIKNLSVACSRNGIPFRAWDDYLAADWNFPKHSEVQTRQLHQLFDRYGEDCNANPSQPKSNHTK